MRPEDVLPEQQFPEGSYFSRQKIEELILATPRDGKNYYLQIFLATEFSRASIYGTSDETSEKIGLLFARKVLRF